MFSGKEYEVVSSAAEQKATVFVSSASGTKIGTLETYTGHILISTLVLMLTFQFLINVLKLGLSLGITV